MQRIVMRSILITAGSVAASFAMGGVLIPLLGGTFDTIALWMCILCPMAIAGPVSFATQVNSKRLADAHDELCKAHERLAVAHADLAEAHSRLAEKARHDDMTGMLNRESFFAALEDARGLVESGTLLIIDADHFKRINDNHGHLTGDDALLAISDAIGLALRKDDLRGRIGGEEFAVFLSGATPAEARQTAERIRREVESIRFKPKNGGLIPLSVSIGAATHRKASTLSELMREADGRLYRAKREGRNRVVFDPDIVKVA
ncbi:MAG: GGDEF domain-containing protein [Rhizobiaceae bacterium]|nr:GGDEF domain-containing protein [Rhizobiaceae bacterium]